MSIFKREIPLTLKCIVFRDPNLWVVKCRMGEEKATAVSLMRKFIAYQFTDEVFVILLPIRKFVVSRNIAFCDMLKCRNK